MDKSTRQRIMQKLPTTFQVDFTKYPVNHFLNMLLENDAAIRYYGLKVTGILMHPKLLHESIIKELFEKTTSVRIRNREWIIFGIPVLQSQDVSENEIKLIIE